MPEKKNEQKQDRKERCTDPLLKVLYVLLKHSDEHHSLKKTEIINKVSEDFYLADDISRNACNNALENVGDFLLRDDNPLGKLNYGTKNCPDRLTRIYVDHLIKDHELRFIMDMISSCEYISLKERQDLIERLSYLSSAYFFINYKSYIRKKIDDSEVKKTEFDNKMKTIHSAIAEGRQIKFNYIDRQSDKKFSHKMINDKLKEYTAHPYRTIFNDGFYYLVCGFSKGNKIPEIIINFRIDRMDNVTLTNKRVCPESDIPGVPKNTNTKKYISTHRMMWGGDLIKCKFRSTYISEVIDFFGDDCKILPGPKEGPFTVEVETTKDNMQQSIVIIVTLICIQYMIA